MSCWVFLGDVLDTARGVVAFIGTGGARGSRDTCWSISIGPVDYYYRNRVQETYGVSNDFAEPTINLQRSILSQSNTNERLHSN
jgi:hypothetical protein